MAIKKSGAQRRKEKKAADEAARKKGIADTRRHLAGLTAVGSSWLEQDAYRGEEYWDPNAPAAQIPLYGIPPARFIKAQEAAINLLEQGSFYQAAYLWDGMTRDDRITASLNTRILGLIGCPLALVPPDDEKSSIKIRDDIEKKWTKLVPSPQLRLLMSYGIGLSVGVAQILTTRTVKSSTPTIRTWNPRFLWWDWLIRKYRMTTMNRGVVVIEPDDPEWLVYEPYGPMGWLHGAAIRPLQLPWGIRYWIRTWWARYEEVHGMPIRLGIVPAERTPEDERVFLGQFANFAHEAAIRLVQGEEGNQFDVKLLEAQANNWEGFQKLIEHCDRSIEITLLGQYQSTEGQGGLGSQEKAGESTMLRVLKGDALVGEQLRERVLVPYVGANYGGDGEQAPDIGWQIDPPEDLEKKATAFEKIAKGLGELAAVPSAIVMVDTRKLLEGFQIPLLPEDQVPEVDPLEPAPGTQPVDGEGDEEDPDESDEDAKGKPAPEKKEGGSEEPPFKKKPKKKS